MGASLEKWVPRALQPRLRPDALRADSGHPAYATADYQFVPARSLVALLALLRLLLTGGKVSKFRVAGLVWWIAPRKLKIAAAGLALSATIVLLGAIAAI